MKLVIRPEARADLAAASRYYEEQGPGLGRTLGRCLDAVFARLCAFRRSGSRVAGYEGVRRALERRFGFGIWYRHDEESVEVLRIVHGPALRRTGPRRRDRTTRDGPARRWARPSSVASS